MLTPEQKAQRDAIREATLSSPAIKECSIVEWGGAKVELRRPSIGKSLQIDKLSRLKDGDKDAARQLTLALFHCVFVPGTDIPVFEPADEQVLLSRGSSKKDFVVFFLDEIKKLAKDDSMEEAEKN